MCFSDESGHDLQSSVYLNLEMTLALTIVIKKITTISSTTNDNTVLSDAWQL